MAVPKRRRSRANTPSGGRSGGGGPRAGDGHRGRAFSRFAFPAVWCGLSDSG